MEIILQRDFTEIPVIDMQQLSDSDGIRNLDTICKNVGFFYLDNHGVDTNLLADLLDLSRKFFDLPMEEKNKIAISQAAHFRGYGKLNAEMTMGKPDYKETYDLGLEKPSCLTSDCFSILHGPNQWPYSQPEFKEKILQYIDSLSDLGYKMMRAISVALGYSERDIETLFNPASPDAYAILRLLRYPPSQTLMGVGEHTDAGFLVFLLQDHVGGLQVKNSNGEWIDVTPKPNCFVVNIGEMLEIWSQGHYKATCHRVLNASAVERYSVPFFYEPHLSAEINGVKYGEKIWKIFQRSYPCA